MNTDNAAIILDESLTTLKCRFRGGDMDYLFICEKVLAATLVAGDLVAAETAKGIQVVIVSSVDSDTELDVNSHIKYMFAFQRIDCEHLEYLNRNLAASRDKLKQLQRDHMRAQVREQIKNSLLVEHNTNGEVL